MIFVPKHNGVINTLPLYSCMFTFGLALASIISVIMEASQNTSGPNLAYFINHIALHQPELILPLSISPF